MRRLLAPLLIALAGSWLACRQLAGIGDIETGSDASDARTSKDSARDDDVLDGDDFGCGCPGCTTLAQGLNLPASLLVVGTNIYFLTYGPEDGQGSLMRVSSAGGGIAETVAGNLTRPFSITADADNFYWQAEDGMGHGIVAKLAMAGGSPVTLAGGLPTLQGIVIMSTDQYTLTADVAVTPTDVYFVGFSGGMQAGVLSVPIGGGVVSTLISKWPGETGTPKAISVNAIVTDGLALYAVTNGPSVGVLRVPLTGGAASVLASELTNPWNLTLSGADVYFLDLGLNATSGTLQEVPADGGTSMILANMLASPWAVVPDDGTLYFVEEAGPAGGSVDSFDIATGKVKALAAELASPVAVAVDSENVYWTDFSCGTVVKHAK
jgi:hypothetical protein